MTTVSDISLKMAQIVTDVLHGKATAGNATSLTDTVWLVQQPDYWNQGTLWVRSGANAGKVGVVSDFGSSVLTFPSMTSSIAAGDLYALIRGAYPFEQFVSAIQQALDETYVIGDDDSLEGDGITLNFVLPADVYDISKVELERDGKRFPSHHCKELSGALRFDYGFAPYDGDIIHVITRKPHDVIVDHTTQINTEINSEWLKLKAAEKLLIWGAGQYHKDPEYLIEERMNIVLGNLKGKMPRRDLPNIRVRAGGG